MNEQTQSLMQKLDKMEVELPDNVSNLLKMDPSEKCQVWELETTIGLARQLALACVISDQGKYECIASSSPPYLDGQVKTIQGQYGKENVVLITLEELTGFTKEQLTPPFAPGFTNIYAKKKQTKDN